MAALVAAAPAQAAPPANGERYDGESGTGQRIHLRVSADGSRLSQYFVAVRMRCSDGRRRILGLSHPNEPTVPVDANGNFASNGDADPLSYRQPGGGSLQGQARTRFTGSFGENSAAGTIRSTFKAGKVFCSREAPFTVFRDGTPGARFRNGTLATGRYAVTGRRLSFRAFRTFAPGPPEVRRVVFRWRASCRGGGNVGSTQTFGNYAIDGRRLSIAGRFRASFGGGVKGRTRYRLNLHFFRQGGTYRVTGSWQAVTRLRRSGSLIDTCRTGVRGFRGRLASGPENLG